jgi:hypothetical protein
MLVAGGGLGAALAFGPAGASASRAALPVAYRGTDGWRGGQARPAVIYIGQTNVFVWTPGWSSWSGSSARTTGELWVNTCTPACSAGHYHTYRAQVRFWDVAVHRGVRYFARMGLSYQHGQQRDYVFRWSTLPGAAIPGWNGGPTGP